MSLLRFRYETIELGDVDIHVRTLRDMREFLDEQGVAEALGISSAAWPLFGIVWASGRVLARLMVDYDVGGRRVLEVGCGIGLASLVLNHRASDITATDYHPEAGSFLKVNVALNGGSAIPFVRTGWLDEDSGLGDFDLIIGSDLLYEGDHVESLAGFIDRHARSTCEVIIVDPGRGQGGRFSKRMVSLGYAHSQRLAESVSSPSTPYHGHILRFLRERDGVSTGGAGGSRGS